MPQSSSKDLAAIALAQRVKDIALQVRGLATFCPDAASQSSARQLQLIADKVATMLESELAAAHAELEETPGWQQLPVQLDDAVEKIRRATEQVAAEQTSSGQFRTTAIQARCAIGPCPSGPTQVQVDNLLIAVASAELAAAIGEATADTLAIFKITALASRIAQAVASGLKVVAAGLALGVAIEQRAADVVAECEEKSVQDSSSACAG